jgi:hypothetical protein
MSGIEADNKFIVALRGEDELGVVVRAHIHIEAGVNALLDVAVPHPPLLPRLRYEQRLRLACALGLAERCFKPLKILGDIRNQFGHKLDTKLTDGMVTELYEALSEQDRAGFMLGVKAAAPFMNLKTTDEFPGLPPKVRFILLAVGLDKLLAQARLEFLEGRE